MASGSSQTIPPANWTYTLSKSKVKAGETIEVIFKASIPHGLHMYSLGYDCPGGGPLPAEFEYTKNKSFTWNGATKAVGDAKSYDDVFECDIRDFHDKAEFRQKIKINSANPVIKGVLSYQMCSEETGMCVFHEFDIEIKGIEVTGGGTGTVTETVTETVTGTGSGNDKASDDKHINESQTSDTGKTTVVDKELLQKLIDCSCGDEGVEGGQPYIEKGAINYATYKRNGDLDTMSCELKTFDGKQEEEKFSYWWFFILAFISGLTALVTPCVFPMIPMTVSFFMKEEDRAKSIRSGLFYSISIILIYVVIGTLVALLAGAAAANWLSTHWIPNVFFFLIFVIFAASFFGAFELTLPSWLVNKVDKQADKGGMFGVFFMAFTIVLVSFSCTGPIVGGILVEASRGAFLKPIIGMFGFSLAFAIPFGLFAIFPSWLNNLPHSGGWLNTVKVVLGFIELALGLKFLSVADQTYHWGILDREVYIALWIVIFGLMGLYLLGKLKFSHDSDMMYLPVPRLIMAILVFSFVVYLIPGMWGAPLKQLAGYLPPTYTHDFNVKSENSENNGHGGLIPKYRDVLHLPDGLQGYFDFEQGMEVARELGMPVLIDFTGHGCVNCREMEQKVWTENRIHNLINEDYVLISLYADEKHIDLPEEEWYISRSSGRKISSFDKRNLDIQQCFFNSNTQPQYALLDNEGNLLQPTRSYDLNREAYYTFLKNGLTEFNKRKQAKLGETKKAVEE
ncbi:MAG: disulfide bond formation protein DsbD [Bacteroidetes bacterium]|nr:disulfide bond formation protein DsbD [Bacteroidota bacterium]